MNSDSRLPDAGRGLKSVGPRKNCTQQHCRGEQHCRGAENTGEQICPPAKVPSGLPAKYPRKTRRCPAQQLSHETSAGRLAKFRADRHYWHFQSAAKVRVRSKRPTPNFLNHGPSPRPRFQNRANSRESTARNTDPGQLQTAGQVPPVVNAKPLQLAGSANCITCQPIQTLTQTLQKIACILLHSVCRPDFLLKLVGCGHVLPKLPTST